MKIFHEMKPYTNLGEQESLSFQRIRSLDKSSQIGGTKFLCFYQSNTTYSRHSLVGNFKQSCSLWTRTSSTSDLELGSPRYNTSPHIKNNAELIEAAWMSGLTITYSLMDVNFIFSCSTRYLTSSLHSPVRYRVDHSKIKFISTHGHVISFMSLG